MALFQLRHQSSQIKCPRVKTSVLVLIVIEGAAVTPFMKKMAALDHNSGLQEISARRVIIGLVERHCSPKAYFRLLI